MIKYSIIVPIYDKEQYLKACIDSIITQSYTNFELLLINDGSKDGSLSIMQSYATDSRIKLFSQENQGVSAARNAGIHLAQGEYLLFVDADDTIESEHLQSLTQAILSEPTDLLITGYNRRTTAKSQVVLPHKEQQRWSQNQAVNEILKYQGIQGFPFNKVFKRALIVNQQLLFDENISIAEDLLFCIAYSQSINSAQYVPLTTYNYFERADSALNSRGTEAFDRRNLSHIEALEKVAQLIASDNHVGQKRAFFAKVYAYSLYYRIGYPMLSKEEREFARKLVKKNLSGYLMADYSGIKNKLGVIYSLVKRNK